MEDRIVRGFEYAKQIYEELGIDVNQAIETIDKIPVSIHSWQGDDLIGFDGAEELSGGIAATGNYPGRARTGDELRSDLDFAFSLIPGEKRVNVHACHAEQIPKGVDRDGYSAEMFQLWIDWARDRRIGLDFNPTFFSHPRMDGNFSLASNDKAVRNFWIEHGKRCREIGAEMGRQTGSPCIVNFWMPDGFKDIPADTSHYRKLMCSSLDQILSEKIDRQYEKDALESKLFGLGIESYTVANHEFSLGYAMSRDIIYTLDCGHFHPTEVVSDKLTSIMQFTDEVLLHVSRGVRWDSDHVVILDDELQRIMQEILFNNYQERVHIGLDFFDASINRIACWVIGVRNVRKALLRAALMPISDIRKSEMVGDFTSRLAMLEEAKMLPFGLIWDWYCLEKDVPVGGKWLDQVDQYERDVLVKRV